MAIFHAIEGGPPVDVVTDEAVLAEGLSYAGEATDFNIGLTTYDVQAGTYNVRVMPTGDTETVLLDLSNTEFQAGTFYFIAAIGTPDAPEALVEAVSVDRLNEESNAEIMSGSSDDMGGDDMDGDDMEDTE